MSKGHSKTTVAIITPSSDMVHAAYCGSLGQMLVHATMAGVRVAWVNPRMSIVHRGRHRGVLEAKKTGADWYLWLDSDQSFPYDTLARLLNHRVPLVGAAVRSRNSPPRLNVFDVRGQKWEALPDGDGVVEVGAIGTGVLLTHSTLFADKLAPWFDTLWQPEAGDWTGEDVHFCNLVRGHAGVKVYCDLKLSREVGHWGVYDYNKGVDSLATKA